MDRVVGEIQLRSWVFLSHERQNICLYDDICEYDALDKSFFMNMFSSKSPF